MIGAWETIKDAKPSDLGGYDVIFPETVTPTDHQGNKKVASAQIVNGQWRVVGLRLLTRTTPVFAEFVMIVVGGLKIGAIYSLAALGIVVIYKATRIVNFAHGAFVLAGAYATYGVVEALGLGYWPAYVLVPIATGLLAAAIELARSAADTSRRYLRSRSPRPSSSALACRKSIGWCRTPKCWRAQSGLGAADLYRRRDHHQRANLGVLPARS